MVAGARMEYMAVRVDTLFDRRVFKAFTRTVGIYPLGTVLRLRSNRLAVVCAQHESEPLRPRVMAFYSVSQSRPLQPQVIDLQHSEDTVVAFEDPADWGYTDEQLLAIYAGQGQAARRRHQHGDACSLASRKSLNARTRALPRRSGCVRIQSGVSSAASGGAIRTSSRSGSASRQSSMPAPMPWRTASAMATRLSAHTAARLALIALIFAGIGGLKLLPA
ncbi:hypothetical protein AWV80_11525 [Cupriavidus sp. UYMU48A]|nr:hypothetical protein AWV80_11525 [Cupriavidus sp. UYMU48A]